MHRHSSCSTLAVLLALTVVHAAAQEAAETPTAAGSVPVIVALGDSVTAGFGLGPRNKFPALLQQRLVTAGYAHRVVNAGRNGDTTTGALRRLDRVLEPNTQVLIVALGGNDRRVGTSADVIESNLSQIIERAQARGVKVLLCDMDTGIGSILARLVEKYGVVQVPAMMAAVRGDPSLTIPDGHPNAIGAKVIAEQIWPHLESLLTK
jgi:acyl-CoA thioesterase-1